MLQNNGDNTSLAETLRTNGRTSGSTPTSQLTIPCFGVVWHNDPSRIGQVAPLHFNRQKTVQLSRLVPGFYTAGHTERSPLLDQYLSRSPILVKRINEREFLFTPPEKRIPISVNGRELIEPSVFHMDELGNEIIILLSNSVVLSLFNSHARFVHNEDVENYGLLGISGEIAATRDAIERFSDGNQSVLIRGETGTGKELIATALFESGRHIRKTMIPVNMATITPSLAAAELFGVKKGAFTGAENDKSGLFEQADEGVLFLDEIGDTPKEVQPMLLRVMENGEFRRVGDDRVRKVDVRIIAATDRKLGPDETDLSFNQPLMRRLEAMFIDVPPLRHRRSDIGILLRKFLTDKSGAMPSYNLSNLSATDVNILALFAWPGNVRELRNLALQLRYGQPFSISAYKIELRSAKSSVRNGKSSNYGDPNKLNDEDILTALDENNWVIKRTAQNLNISRTALYELMRKSAVIRTIDDVADDELHTMLNEVSGSYNEWAKHLRVGRESLRKRLRTL